MSSIRTIDQMGEFVEEHARRAGGPRAVRRRQRSPAAVADREAAVADAPADPARRRVVEPPRDRAITTVDGRADVRQLGVGRGPVRDGHELSGSLPAHPHLADVRSVGSGRRRPCAARARIDERGSQQYREDYAAYYHAFAEPDSPALRDRNPSVVVIPGLGLFGFGKDKREARITTEFFVNAIHVMSGANALERSSAVRAGRCHRRGGRAGDGVQDASTTTSPCRGPRRSGSNTGRSRKPSCSGCRRRSEFSRKVVVVVGGGSGIGREVALQIAQRGGHSSSPIRTSQGAEETAAEAATRSSTRDGHAAALDLTSRDTMAAAMRAAVLQFGGFDVRGQHRGDLSDAGSLRAGGSRVGRTLQINVTSNYRAGAGSGEGAAGAEAPGVNRADELRQRGGAEAGERGVRREQGRDQSSDPRAGDRPRSARSGSTASRRRR